MKTAKKLPPIPTFFTCALCLLLSLETGRAQSDRPPVMSPEIVVLPELEVIGKRYRWVYVKIGHFELYSNLDDEQFIKNFARFQNVSYDFIKSQFQEFLSGRTLQKKYILCYESTRRERFGVLERPRLERSKGDQSIRFYTYENNGGELFEYHTNVPVRNMHLYPVLRDTMVDNIMPRRFMTQRMPILFGDWFRLGLECMRLYFDYDTALEHNEYAVAFDNRAMGFARKAAQKPDVAEMLEGFPDSPGPRTGENMARNPLNAIKCFNFVYYCIFANPERYRIPLANFLAWQEKHEPTEEAFLRIFGVNYETMENEIRNYFVKIYNRRGTIGSRTIPLSSPGNKQKKLPEKIILSDVIRSQSSRLLSDIYYVAGDEVRARQLLLKAVQEQPLVMRDPEFKAAMALNELYTEDGDADKAVLYLEELAQGNIQRPRIYAELAYQRLRTALAASESSRRGRLISHVPGDLAKTDVFFSQNYQGEASLWLNNLRVQSERHHMRKLSAEDINRVMEPLIKAFASYKSESLYVMLTAIWFLSGETPPEDIIIKIKEGCFLYPRNITMLKSAIDILKRDQKHADSISALLIRGFTYANKRDEAKAVDIAIDAYDIEEPIAERNRNGVLREQLQRFDEVMQKAKAPPINQRP